MATRLEAVARYLAAHGRADMVADVASLALRFPPVRRQLFRRLKQDADWLIANTDTFNPHRPRRVKQDRMRMFRALIGTVERALERKAVSPPVFRKMVRALIVSGILREERKAAMERFMAAHGGYGPPGFILVSPGKVCNLHCRGCYASSGANREKLAWEVFDRILTEARELWNTGFVVISGGEPLVYRDQGLGMLDMAARHPQSFFMMYTNGTLIDDKTAARMAELGNITPAISLEGWEERTDARRGPGVFRKILRAMASLRAVGVPFGISLTATCQNCEEILSDEFLDFCFEEQGATYGWIFHYMPIGRGYTLELLPTPEQRAWMWRRVWEVIEARGYFLADFWNLGTCSDGCISAGREGGYLCIDWSGQVIPCVFMPYVGSNIYEIYRAGGNLSDALDSPFFKAVRAWQNDYAFLASRPAEHHNWLMPCPIRDHHRDFRQILAATEPDPEDEAARQAMLDPAYRDGLIAYNRAVAAVLDPIWEREYMDHEHDRGGAPPPTDHPR